MVSDSIFRFLTELKKNNNKPWFDGHKDLFKHCMNDFEKFVASTITEVNTFDPSVGTPTPKDCIFRIYRDLRFSPNKEPYKPNFGAFLSPGGRKSSRAGYYIHIEPGGCFAGGGVYAPMSPALKAMRNEIYHKPDEFIKIINATHFKRLFGEIAGDKLTRIPQGFPADFQYPELISYKSYEILYPLEDKQCQRTSFSRELSGIFKTMKDYNNFLNHALEMAE
jgi:uncharacterized protein (TIGR02453 family)